MGLHGDRGRRGEVTGGFKKNEVEEDMGTHRRIGRGLRKCGISCDLQMSREVDHALGRYFV
jgi:hypothetical protein